MTKLAFKDTLAHACSVILRILAFSGFITTIVFECLLLYGWLEQSLVFHPRPPDSNSLFWPLLKKTRNRPVVLWAFICEISKDIGLVLISLLTPRIKRGRFVVILESVEMNRWTKRAVFLAFVRFILLMAFLENDAAAGFSGIVVATTISLSSFLVTFISNAVIPQIGVTKIKDRIKNAAVVSCIGLAANILGTSLYILTVTVSMIKNNLALDTFKGGANNSISFLAAIAFRSLLMGTVNTQKKATKDFADMVERGDKIPHPFRIESNKFVLDANYLDMEEAFELGFASTPHVFLAVYNIASLYIVMTAAPTLFVSCAVSNVVLDLCFQVAYGLIRRRHISKEMGRLFPADLEVNDQPLPSVAAPPEKRYSEISMPARRKRDVNSGESSQDEDDNAKGKKRLSMKGDQTLFATLNRVEDQFRTMRPALLHDVRRDSDRRKLTLRNFLIDEGARVVANMMGTYMAMEVLWIICVMFFAKDGIFPPVNVHFCIGDLLMHDFNTRFLILLSLRVFADVVLFLFEHKQGVPVHLVRMRYPLSALVGFSFYTLMHGCLLVTTSRGISNEILGTQPLCLQKFDRVYFVLSAPSLRTCADDLEIFNKILNAASIQICDDLEEMRKNRRQSVYAVAWSSRVNKTMGAISRLITFMVEVSGLAGFVTVLILEIILISGFVEQAVIFRQRYYMGAAMEATRTKTVYMWAIFSDVAKDVGIMLALTFSARMKYGNQIAVIEETINNSWMKRAIAITVTRFTFLMIVTEVAAMLHFSSVQVAYSFSFNTTRERVLSAVKTAVGAIILNLITATLYYGTVALATMKNSFIINIVKNVFISSLAFVASSAGKYWSSTYIDNERKMIRSIIKNPQDTAFPNVKVEFRNFTRDPEMIDPEEAYEITYSSIPYIAASLYNISAFYNILTTSPHLFYSSVLVNILVDFCFRAILNRLRRRKIFDGLIERKMEKAMAKRNEEASRNVMPASSQPDESDLTDETSIHSLPPHQKADDESSQSSDPDDDREESGRSVVVPIMVERLATVKDRRQSRLASIGSETTTPSWNIRPRRSFVLFQNQMFGITEDSNQNHFDHFKTFQSQPNDEVGYDTRKKQLSGKVSFVSVDSETIGRKETNHFSVNYFPSRLSLDSSASNEDIACLPKTNLGDVNVDVRSSVILSTASSVDGSKAVSMKASFNGLLHTIDQLGEDATGKVLSNLKKVDKTIQFDLSPAKKEYSTALSMSKLGRRNTATHLRDDLMEEASNSIASVVGVYIGLFVTWAVCSPISSFITPASAMEYLFISHIHGILFWDF
ncbi:hypothetical protein HDU97_004405 [Phlyctochytrium planicorne]|nr:hypothetical protein HDU97_004405 [Phlyctochytrium planicorne]